MLRCIEPRRRRSAGIDHDRRRLLLPELHDDDGPRSQTTISRPPRTDHATQTTNTSRPQPRHDDDRHDAKSTGESVNYIYGVLSWK